MSKSKRKLIIIDGNALIHRSFHALPPTLRTKEGLLVNAVYGFTSFLLKALQEFHPEYVVLTLDKKDPTFRHKAYSEYKATRVKAPNELYEQIPLVKKVAKSFNIPIFELSGFEADDLIGTICQNDQLEKNLENIIITGDMDTLQLVNDQTKVYTMSRGLSDPVLYDKKIVLKRYGLNPDQIIDYKALRGDPSDNIPGVKGVGEKTAQELLQNFHDLDGVYQAVAQNSAKIKPRILGLLTQYKSDAYLSRQLATIERHAPIKFSLKDATYGNFSLEAVRQVFSDLEFRSLLNRLKDLHDRLEKESEKDGSQKNQSKAKKSDKAAGADKIRTDYILINNDKKLTSFLKTLKQQKDFSLMAAPVADPDYSHLHGLSFSWKNNQAYYLPAAPKNLTAVKDILEDEKINKSGHDLKITWHRLHKRGLNLKGLNFDTAIASYLLNPGDRRHNLDSLIFSELGQEKLYCIDDRKKPGENLSLLPTDANTLAASLNEDADLNQRLTVKLTQKLKEQKLWDLFKDIEMPLIEVLAKMEARGIKLNPKILTELNQKVNRRLKTLTKKIYKLAGDEFNINSPKQLQAILFEKLELDPTAIKKTKTGYSTAENQLKKLQEQHEIIPLLQSYRELNKLQTTYLNALPRLVEAKDGRLHTNFKQTATATGRLSSTEPNLQNIPTRTPEGRAIRRAFVADTGSILLSLDYSQIELRLAALMSGDKKMITAFQKGEDIHAATAAAINEVKLDEVTPKMRREAKAINFGILYGQGPHGLSQTAGIPYWRAQEFITKYFQTYPGIKKMTQKFIKKAGVQGYALTRFGRKRPLPELNSPIAVLKRAAERMAINTPIQGTAADIIKIAMIKIDRLLADKKNEINLLLQVHDELIFELKEAKLETYLPLIKNIMQTVIKLSVPLTVEASTGHNWGELK